MCCVVWSERVVGSKKGCIVRFVILCLKHISLHSNAQTRFLGLIIIIEPGDRVGQPRLKPAMDPQQRPLMSDRVTVNGTVTPLALLADGRLWWSEGVHRCLSVEKDVLSFVTSGPYIKIKSLVETRDGCCSTGASTRLARNDVVFMPSSEESHRLWCQKLCEFVDSLGKLNFTFLLLLLCCMCFEV